MQTANLIQAPKQDDAATKSLAVASAPSSSSSSPPSAASHDKNMSSANNLIDGKCVAAAIREEVRKEIQESGLGSSGLSPLANGPGGAKEETSSSRRPKLAVVLVGDRRDSATYVTMKEKACKECGIESSILRLPDTSSEEEIKRAVERLNQDPLVDGILVQLPLPAHVCEKSVLMLIDWSKDVDGLHPLNVGSLALRGHEPMFKPCTAEGVIELCRRYKVQMEGASVVVIGRSNIVGLPLSLLFLQENATVTVCHSRTRSLPTEVSKADIVVAAIGRPRFVKSEWIKEGAVLIDVGINAVDDATSAKGYRLVGDVDFENCVDKCKLITPVPGGVGPMTVALLMKNTLAARKHRSATELKAR